MPPNSPFPLSTGKARCRYRPHQGSTHRLACLRSGKVASGALAGDYVGPRLVPPQEFGLGANVLIGGSYKEISLQPVTVEDNVGLNFAGRRGGGRPQACKVTSNGKP